MKIKSTISIALSILYGCMLLHFGLAHAVHFGLHHYKSSLHSHTAHHHASHDHTHAMLNNDHHGQQENSPSEVLNTFTVLKCIANGAKALDHPVSESPQRTLGFSPLPFLSHHSAPAFPPPQAIS